MENGYRDPTADELVQRFRLTSTSSLTSPKLSKPPLTVFKRGSSVIRSVDVQSVAAYSLSRNCVSSLHQNFRSSLLYGKNNVTVTTSDGSETLKGYLSLHQEHKRAITLKWMPNQLMHSSSQSSSDSPSENGDSSRLWKHTIMVNINDIIYIHLHSQGAQQPISLVFVDAEGVQHRPFQFPPGQHCVQFLACLESALLPNSRLDPPLWFEPGKGKALPQVKRKSSFFRRASESSTDENQESRDYVFRIRRVNSDRENSNSSTPAAVPLKNNVLNEFVHQNGFRSHSNSLPNSPALTKKRVSSASVRSREMKPPQLSRAKEVSEQHSSIEKVSLMDACETVRRQILSRAFYGWLSYCRHMKTVRTHLACTINNIKLDEALYAGKIVDRDFWERCRAEQSIDLQKEFWIRTYLNGIQPELRAQAWPYLLNLIGWNENTDGFRDEWRKKYEQKVDKWKEIEKEVIKRDCEQFENARMRQSSEVDHYENSNWGKGKSMSTEVFMESSTKSKTDNLIEEFGTNLHRIEKDVERCDRHTQFFSNKTNLEKLKNIMCSYVWEHLDDGYVQGMCDIAAPLLVIFQDESLTLECFEVLMEKMKVNFPHSQGNAIESNLVNLRTIVQVMDTELYQQFMNDTDYTHLYFAYRWFLLDFKREMKYDDVFKVWEVIWAAEHTVSSHFQLFFALAMLTNYRQILLENNMEFTDVIKFFNEMAEKHNVPGLLQSARGKVTLLQDLVSNSTFEEALDR